MALSELQVYTETTISLLASQQGRSLKAAVAEAQVSGMKNKVEAQLKRLSKVLTDASTVNTSAKLPPKSERKEQKAAKQKLRAEKKAERKNKSKKSKTST